MKNDVENTDKVKRPWGKPELLSIAFEMTYNNRQGTGADGSPDWSAS
jgi:hypothetical protein